MLTDLMRLELLGQIKVAEEQLPLYHPPSRWYSLEARYSLFQLKKILERPLHSTTADRLVACLYERWLRVQCADCQYLCDFTNPANEVCIRIAKALATSAKPYLTLIMPSLLRHTPASYLTSSYQDDLNLKEIILSDCKERLISIPDVLDGSQVDGVLKHNYMSARSPSRLSRSEQERLLSRHPTVRAAHEALQARVTYKLHGDTAGAALSRLIQGLREGGESQFAFGDSRRYEATFDSGHSANTAIVAFDTYLESLDPDTRKVLLNAKVDNLFSERGSKSVRKLWGRLARPKDVAYREGGTYCVELIANDLEEILREKPELYDLASYQEETGASLAILDVDVVRTSEAMKAGIVSITHSHWYGADGDSVLHQNVLRSFDFSQGFILRPDDIACIADRYARNRLHGFGGPYIRSAQDILMYVKRNYDPANIIIALEKMTPEAKAQFLRFTGFRVPAPRPPREEVGGFFGKANKLKRGAERAGFVASNPSYNEGEEGLVEEARVEGEGEEGDEHIARASRRRRT